MNKFLLTLLLLVASLNLGAQVTATFADPPGTEFDVLPDKMDFSLSEPMNGLSPTVVIKGVTQELKRTCMRGSDYQNFYFWLSYYVKGELLEEIQSTGEFTVTITLNDGTELEPVMFKLKRPITVTFADPPGTEFDVLPDKMDFSLSEPMNGLSPTVVIKGVTQELKRTCMREGSDYQNFYFWLSYYVKGELLEEIQSTGEFTVTITLNDGTELEPVGFKLKKKEEPVTALFDDAQGKIFAGLPQRMDFSLSRDWNDEPPYAVINDGHRVACYRDGESARDFYISPANDIAGDAGIVIPGILSVELHLTDDNVLDAAKFYLVPADIEWTALAGSEPGRVFSSLPKSLEFTLTAELPEDGVADSGLVLSSAVVYPFAGWDIELPCSIDGRNVVFDLSALGAEDVRKIEENEDFTVVLAMGGKCLSASYELNIRRQPVTLGYCPDDFNANDMFLGSEGAATTVGGAVKIPAAKLEGLKGGVITKLRIGMGTGMERVYAWIRPSLSEPAIVMKKIEDFGDGWTEVEFDAPYTITGDEIFIGYSGHQPVGVKAIRAGGPDRPDACWLGIKDSWEDFSDRGYGSLYIQAVGEATLPSADLGVDNLRLDKEYYRSSETAVAEFTIFNSGANDINSYTISWSVDGGEAVETEINEPVASDSRANHRFEIPLDGYADGIHSFKVSCLIKDSGVTDPVEGNDSESLQLAIYTDSYPRTVLLEQFTTINCVNCPAGTAALKVAVAERGDVAWVAHHVGFGVDEFTIEESNALMDFGVIGAPSLMIDRTSFNGGVPPLTIGYQNAEAGGAILKGYIDQCVSLPAFAGLEISNSFDEDTRMLTINIEGEKNAIFSQFNPECNYSVFLTEDNLISKVPQIGASGLYIHDHVLRKVLTPILGEPVEWDGNHFSTTIQTSLDPAWEAGRMHIIAVLNKPFNTTDVRDSQVLNAAVIPVDATLGVGSVMTDGQLRIDNGMITGEGLKDIEVYSVDGMRLSNYGLGSGFYVVRAIDSDGNVSVIKTYIK